MKNKEEKLIKEFYYIFKGNNFDASFNKLKMINGKAEPYFMEDWIRETLLSYKEEIGKEYKAEIKEKIKKIDRFKCGACEGVKCSHCQACLMREEIINIIK